jgi:hypothetical protein
MGLRKVFYIALFSVVACGGDTGPVGDPSGAGGPDAAPDVEPGPDAAVSVRLGGVLFAPLPSPHYGEGVTMTIDGHPEIPAVVSDAQGQFSFPAVPPNTDLVVIGEKEGYMRVASRVVNTGATDAVVDVMMMLETTTLPLLADISQVELMPGTGIVMGSVANSADDSAMAGISAALDPDAGVFRYAAENGFVDPQLTATTSQGTFVIWHLAPGDYTVSVGSEANTSCRSKGLDSAPTATVRIYADTLSHASFHCD